MATTLFAENLQAPNYIVGPHGEPVAVVIDIGLWRMILKQLEDHEDLAALRKMAADIEALAMGKRPSGWKSLEEFEAELEELETAGALPA